jgi:ssDNA-binding Zn-finger/Zn-ribbon topoisomerase 1
MSNSRWLKIGMGVVALLFLAWGGFMLATEGSKKTAPVRVEANKCPDCGRSLPKGAQVARECPYCKLDPNAKKKKWGSQPGRSPVIPAVLGGLFVVLLAVHLGVIFRKRLGAQGEEVLYYWNCPKCQRKLRYRERQVGQASLCPLCRRPLVFPRPEEPERGPAYRAVAGRIRQFFFPTKQRG